MKNHEKIRYYLIRSKKSNQIQNEATNGQDNNQK